MFDHIGLRAADFEASSSFYRTVLAALEIEPDGETERWSHWGEF